MPRQAPTRSPAHLNLTDIRTDGGTQARATMNQETVVDYSAAMTDGAQFPPLDVMCDQHTYWLVDGFHRYRAAQTNGETSILCTITAGTLVDAVLRAAGANQAHGLRRSNGDKRRAVAMVLSLPTYADRSDREVARLCGVTHPFVAACRRPEVPVDEAQDQEPTDGEDSEPGSTAEPEEQTSDMADARAKLRGVVTELTAIKRSLGLLARVQAGAFLNLQAINGDLDNAIAAVRGATPARTCPVCHGTGCRTCRTTGWVSRLVNEHALPAEFR